MANQVVIITLGKKPHDKLENSSCCMFEGQAKQKYMDNLMMSDKAVWVIDKKSKLMGVAKNIRCVEQRDKNVTPKWVFELSEPPLPQRESTLVEGEKYRFRKEFLYMHGLRVIQGQLNQGIFLCEQGV